MKKILIVDDDPTILYAISVLMTSRDSLVTSCDTLEAAIKALSQSVFDLVITDVGLTGKDGLEGLVLLDHVREMSPLTAVIVVTGKGTDEIKEHACRQKAYYIEKSLEISHLLSIVKLHGIMIPEL